MHHCCHVRRIDDRQSIQINLSSGLGPKYIGDALWYKNRGEFVISAVTIIVVMIFIAIFYNYRIISLSQDFLCVRNDIFARHLRFASTIYSSFSTLLSHAVNDRLPFVKDAATAFEVPCHRWSPWPEQSSWRHNSQLPACVYVVAFKFCWVWTEH